MLEPFKITKRRRFNRGEGKHLNTPFRTIQQGNALPGYSPKERECNLVIRYQAVSKIASHPPKTKF